MPSFCFYLVMVVAARPCWLTYAPMDLSLEKLKEAVSIREQIDSLQQRLSSLFGSSGGSSSSTPSSSSSSSSSSTSTTSGGGATKSARRGRGRGRRGQMSAETRAKLAEAARRRWASGGNIGNTTSRKSSGAKSGGGAKGRGRLSAAGRKAISDAMKARWAARRAGKKS